MSDYPRDLKDKDGNVKEFKRIEDVPPGWFVRDTGEEVNPLPVPEAVAVDPPADIVEPPKPKKKGKAAPVEPQPVQAPDTEPTGEVPVSE